MNGTTPVAPKRLPELSQTFQAAGELLVSIARTRRQKRDVPRLLTYIVTFRCNARCIMCDSWRKEEEDELTLDELDAIFATLPAFHAVRLTGGEPFVRKDFEELAAIVERRLRPGLLHITSNGFLTDRIVRYCERRPKDRPLELLISLDGVDDKHDRVRGRANAWQTAFATLKALAPRQDELGLRLAVNQTIVDAEGAAHYRLLHERLAPLGVRHQMVMAYDVSATYSLKRETDVAPTQVGAFSTFGAFDRQDIERLLDDAQADVNKFAVAERMAKSYYLRGVRNRLLGSEGTPNPPCVALGAHMRLFPNGDVPTCQFNTKRVGNLRSQTFDEIWQSEAAETQRAWVRKCAGCWAECEVIPSAIYSGDLAREAVRQIATKVATTVSNALGLASAAGKSSKTTSFNS